MSLMFHESLAFGGTHPPEFSGVHVTEYKSPTREVQDRWRQTQHHPSSASEPDRHTVCRGRKVNNNRRYINDTGLNPTKPYEPRETCIGWHGPRDSRSPCYRIQVSHPGSTGSVETNSNTNPPSASEADRHTVRRGRKGDRRTKIH